MKRTTLIPTGAALLAALGIAAGGVALAQGSDAADLAAFIDATPGAAEGLAAVEARTGGTVTEADLENDAPGLIEFEVQMPDGSEADALYAVDDGTITVETEDDDGIDDEEFPDDGRDTQDDADP